MLLGVDPLLRGAALQALDEMGHGDVLLICDANFPAKKMPGVTIDMPGIDGPSASRAIAAHFPIDPEEPVTVMATPDGAVTDVQKELAATFGLDESALELVDRHEFYDRAGEAQVIIHSGEMRKFANLLVRKGVI